MKVLKPSWVNHDGKPIFSIDIHPDGSRFATGGQGDDCGKIIVWNMGPVIDKSKEYDENVPKILSQMDHHMGCVNSVRWSHNGQYLASGADDKLVMIWAYAQTATYQNIENWKCTFTLRGHSGDVLDLAWSHSDEYLASCSVDNTIIIWNTLKFPEMITRINAHSGFVKGVTWDPIGKYIASQSDDKTVKVWRTDDWSLEKTIDEPFRECGGTTHILRLDWSPDGQLLISAHAMNNGVPTAQIIERNAWRTKLDFVGHRKAVTCVKFYPQIFKMPKLAENDETKTYCICAVGSRDRSLSIWLTSLSRPISVLHDVFENPIMDITWCKEPIGLLCCSMDGTVAYLELSHDEAGETLDKNELETFFKLKYSFDINAECLTRKGLNDSFSCLTTTTNQRNKPKKFIEDIDILIAQEKEQENQQAQQHQQQQQQQASQPDVSMTESNSQMSTSKRLSVESHRQIERRLPDGRRRITPICMSKANDFELPKPFGSFDIKLQSQTATEQSTIIVEKRDDKDEVIDVSPVKSIQYTRQMSSAVKMSCGGDSQHEATVSQTSITTTTTVALSDLQSDVVEMKTTKTTTTTTTTMATEPVIPATKPVVDLTSKLQQASKAQASASVQSVKAKSLTTNPIVKQVQQPQPKPPVATQSTTVQQVKAAPQQQQGSKAKSSQVKPQAKPQQQQQSNEDALMQCDDDDGTENDDQDQQHNKQLSRSISANGKHVHHSFNLQPAKFDSNKTVKTISTKSGSRPLIELEVENTFNNIKTLNYLRYKVNSALKWKTLFNSAISAIAYCKVFVVCATTERLLTFLTQLNGTYLCNSIIVDDAVVVLKCNQHYTACLTCNASLYLWKYDSFSNSICTIVNGQACLAVLKGHQFMDLTLTDNGTPVLYTNNNSQIYYYSQQTQCFHLIPSYANNADLILNSYLNDEKTHAGTLGPLALIQATDNQDKSSNPIKHDYTLMHIESQLNASLGLNSAKEYKFWLLTYVRYLCDNSKLKHLSAHSLDSLPSLTLFEAYEDKLKELCTFLLGPLYSQKWNHQVLTFNKHDLLNDVLNLIAQNLNLQRIYTSYKQQLASLTNRKSSISETKQSEYEQRYFRKFNDTHKPIVQAVVASVPVIATVEPIEIDEQQQQHEQTKLQENLESEIQMEEKAEEPPQEDQCEQAPLESVANVNNQNEKDSNENEPVDVAVVVANEPDVEIDMM